MLKLLKSKKRLLLVTFVTACSHAPDVRPYSDGINNVKVQKATKERAEQSAFEQSKNYCQAKKQSPEIISENCYFQDPEKDEADYLRDLQARGGKHESSLSALINELKHMTPYFCEISFKCK